MIKFDTPIDSQIQQLWQWWRDEMLTMVPTAVQKLFGGAREFLIIEAEKGHLDLSHQTPAGESHLVTLGSDQFTPSARDNLLEKHPELTGCREVLRLSKNQGLHKAIKLPLVADGELVLEDQLEKVEVAKSTGLCLLEPDLERLGQPRKPQLPEDRAEMITHGRKAPGMNSTTSR